MIGRLAIVACAVGCGRFGFDPLPQTDGLADGFDGSYDIDFTRSEFTGLSITRASPATYADASGRLRVAAPNEPRFDHIPGTGEPIGLLVEEPRTNFLSGSETVDASTYWFTIGASTTTADVAIAPDGTMTADAVNDIDTTMNTRRGQGVAITNDMEHYAFSIFVKAGTRSTVSLYAELTLGTSVQTLMKVDLATGAIIQPPSLATAWGAEPWANGWYRLFVTIQNNGLSNTDAIISVFSDWDNIAETGSVYVWGAQIERGDRASSHIPTTTAAATRDADIITGVPTWLTGDRGAIRTTASIHGVLGNDQPALCMIADTTRRTCLERDGGAGKVSLATYGSTASEVLGRSWGYNEARTCVVAWQPGDIALWDGGVSATPETIASPIATVGFGTDGTRVLQGHLKRMTYWPKRLSDPELAAVGTSP